MAETRTVKLNVETNAQKVAQDMNSVANATNAAADATQNLGDAQAEAGEKSSTFDKIKEKVFGMVPALKAADEGVGSFIGNLKALMANPIVLVITGIVAALKFIYEAFAADVKIGKEIKQVWAALSAVGTQITDAVFGMARAFGYAVEAAYKFITLDFEGASEAMSKANGEVAGSFDQLTKAVNGTTFAIVKGLEKRQQANDKARKDEEVRASEVEKMLVQSRETLSDELATFKEKHKALDDVTKAEKSYAALKLRTAKEDLDILEAKAKALGGNAEKKMKQEIREATIALNEAEKENALTSIKLHKQRKLLAKQEADEAKAKVEEVNKDYIEKQKAQAKARKDALDKIREAEKEYTDSFLTDQQREINEVEKKYKELIDIAKKYKQDTTKLEEARRNALNDIDVKYLKQAEELRDKLNAERIKKEDDEWLRRQNAILSKQDYEILLLQQAYDKEMELAEGDAEWQKALTDKLGSDINAINKKYYDEEVKAKEETNKKIEDLEKQKNDIIQRNVDFTIKSVQDSFSFIVSLASKIQSKYENLNKAILSNDKLTDKEKQKLLDENNARAKKAFDIQKNVSLASALITTYQSVVSAYQSQFLPLPDPTSPVRGAIAAGLALATGLANVKNIASQKFEGASVASSSGGASSSSGIGGSVMTPNFNIVGNAQATNPLAGLGNQPIQAYVVSGEVTTAQSLDRNRINYATFG